ncbi:MAG: riboflavin synthase, partial [Enterococcus casseliflavus]
VAGHIDVTTRLVQKKQLEKALILTFAYPVSVQGEIIPQGSIAINGVSLTVTQTTAQAFSVSLIPHSKDQTTLGQLKQGEWVNIETDMIGKYVKYQRK